MVWSIATAAVGGQPSSKIQETSHGLHCWEPGSGHGQDDPKGAVAKPLTVPNPTSD